MNDTQLTLTMMHHLGHSRDKQLPEIYLFYFIFANGNNFIFSEKTSKQSGGVSTINNKTFILKILISIVLLIYQLLVGSDFLTNTL